MSEKPGNDDQWLAFEKLRLENEHVRHQDWLFFIGFLVVVCGLLLFASGVLFYAMTH